jgi:DHA2 family multidrug resistance protein-like MFS transporter
MDETTSMSKWKRWSVLGILSSALFLVSIDTTVLFTALPKLTHDLHASNSQKLWIINAYGLVVAGLLPAVGTLGDRFGHNKLLMLGFVLFGISSLAAAFAPTANLLIAARAALAVGAALMMPATLALLRFTFVDEHERALALGIWASIAAGASAIGPVISGLLLEYFWWGSVFLVNVPVVAIALVGAYFLIPGGSKSGTSRFDLHGSIQVVSGLVASAYSLKELSKPNSSLPVALATGVFGIAMLMLFVRRQKARSDPIIDMSLFHNPRFKAAVFAALMVTFAVVGIDLLLSQRYQLALGFSPLQAGLMMLAIPAAGFVSGPLTGMALPRIGAPRILWSGMLLMGAGYGVFLTVYHSSYPLQIAALAVAGLGVGAAMTATSSAIMANSPANQAGMSASIESTSIELGCSMGVVILGSLVAAIYSSTLVLPDQMKVSPIAYDSLDQAILVAEQLVTEDAQILAGTARSCFDNACFVVLAVGSIMLILSAVLVRKMMANVGGNVHEFRRSH